MRAHSPVEDVIRTRVEEHPDAVLVKFRDENYTCRTYAITIRMVGFLSCWTR